MYEVFVGPKQDVPGAPMGRDDRACARGRSTGQPLSLLSFVAIAGEEVVGYAALDVVGDEGHHGFTAVKRAWRRRGVATALKRARSRARAGWASIG